MKTGDSFFVTIRSRIDRDIDVDGGRRVARGQIIATTLPSIHVDNDIECMT